MLTHFIEQILAQSAREGRTCHGDRLHPREYRVGLVVVWGGRGGDGTARQGKVEIEIEIGARGIAGRDVAFT